MLLCLRVHLYQKELDIFNFNLMKSLFNYLCKQQLKQYIKLWLLLLIHRFN
jgi:hypothetical protein